MPRRRSGSDDDDAERRTYLAKSKETVDADLEGQIAKGRDLLAQLDVHVFLQPGRVDELGAEFRAWHNYARAYLERAFTTKEISEEFEPAVVIGFLGRRQTDLERLRDLADDLKRDINKLADIKARLALYEPVEQEQGPQTRHAAPRSDQRIHVTFAGQVGQVTFSDLVQRLNAEIAQVDRRGDANLAGALQHLADAVKSADEPQESREDVLDAIAVLAEVGSSPVEERGRFRGRVRGAIEVIKDLAAAAPTVKQAWDAWGPQIMEHLPRVGS